MSLSTTTGSTTTGATAVLRTPGQVARRRQVTLAARPSAPGWARRVVRHALREWQRDALADQALLLVSELVTNAVAACAGGPGPGRGQPVIELTVVLTGAGLLLEVWDPSPCLPVLREADVGGDHGRGLLLVDFLADAWGHRAASGGKVVWCELRA